MLNHHETNYHPDIHILERIRPNIIDLSGEIMGEIIIFRKSKHQSSKRANTYFDIYCCRCGEFSRMVKKDLVLKQEKVCYDCKGTRKINVRRRKG